MVYLEPSEYVLYGLDAETPDALVSAASAMVDAFCRRSSLAVTTYVERLRFGRDRQTLRLSHAPLTAAAGAATVVTACRVRLRRVDAWSASPMQLDAAVFGLGGAWSDVAPVTIAVYPHGEIELAGHVLGLCYDEAEVTYTAGFDEMPQAIKLAVAQIVRNAQATPGLNVKRQQVDAMELEYFAPSLLDDETKRLLRPFVSVRLA